MSDADWTRLTAWGAFRTGSKGEAEAKGLIEREKRRLAMFDLFALEDLVKEITKMKLPSVKGALEDKRNSWSRTVCTDRTYSRTAGYCSSSNM